MKLDLYHVDAFAEQIFQGNPAAVCVLHEWLPDAIMQAIASELNLSETAFAVRRNDDDFRIRWFTPSTEIALCGHATLATGHVLFNHLNCDEQSVRFHSLSGPLVVSRNESSLTLDLPVQAVSPIEICGDIADAMNVNIKEAYAGEDLIILLSDASEVEIFEPDLAKIAKLPYRGVCISAPGNGNGFDFVNRFFAPAYGINEDPVTGSSFTKLAPIYSLKFGKTEFRARQVSSRGGNVLVSLEGDRVFLSGSAQTVMHSHLTLPGF